jgi:putative membrane protein
VVCANTPESAARNPYRDTGVRRNPVPLTRYGQAHRSTLEESVQIAANILIGLVAVIHVYILVLEMFLWEGPRGQKAFGLTPEYAKETKALAANQGLYNGFLAAGLVWALIADGETSFHFAVFFLLCVMVAGVYGALTASKKIIFVQALPATIALVAVLIAH